MSIKRYRGERMMCKKCGIYVKGDKDICPFCEVRDPYSDTVLLDYI